MEKRRAIFFIDGSNFYHNSKSIIDKPSKIDFKSLSKFICDNFQLELKFLQINSDNLIKSILPGLIIDLQLWYQLLPSIKIIALLFSIKIGTAISIKKHL